MSFRVIKSGFDGISGGDSRYDSIKDVLREISYSKGWDSIEQLHKSITKWAKSAKPGSVFSTQVTAIVVARDELTTEDHDECSECGHEGLDYGEFELQEGAHLEQEVWCPECGARWSDMFEFAERRELAKKS
jgi:DNA-directed RNA polymerase subunit M/transcription elongation factor TFIIS